MSEISKSQWGAYFHIGLKVCIALFLLVFLYGYLPAQSFKAFYEVGGAEAPLELDVMEIIQVPDGDQLLFTGQVKHGAPDYQAIAYVCKVNSFGLPIGQKAIRTNFANIQNGLVSNSIATDGGGNIFVGGASIQNRGNIGAGSERTITAIDPGGNIDWSIMQANHSFNSILFSPDNQRIVSLSGQVGNSNPNTDIMFNMFDKDGVPRADFTLGTNSRDSAVKLIEVADGYIGIATMDVEANPMPMVVKVDKNLDEVWSYSYELPGHHIWVSDIVELEGFLGISGTILDLTTQEKRVCLLNLTPMGEFNYFSSYYLGNGSNTISNGICAYESQSDNREKGFIIVGNLYPGNGQESRAFGIGLDEHGSGKWARDYSNFSPWTDYTYSEGLNDVTSIKNGEDFVAAGQFTRFLHGNPNYKAAVVLRANVLTGNLEKDANGCAAPMRFFGDHHILSQDQVGSPYFGGGSTSFGYQNASVEFDLWYCAFRAFREARTDGPSMSIELQNETRDSYRLSYTYDPEWGDAKAELLNLNGQRLKILNLKADKAHIELDLAELPASVYILRIYLADQMVHREKIVVH